MNPFCDKYFTKSKMVAAHAGLNPIAKWRFFMRDEGIAALKPAAELAGYLCSDAKVKILPTGTRFNAKDTVMTVEAPFQSFVEHETQVLQWIALPCATAFKTAQLLLVADDRPVMDFHARHMFGSESVALTSYGAKVGGIEKFSTDIGANAESYLSYLAFDYTMKLCSMADNGYIAHRDDDWWPKEQGVGTTPHALIAIFNGDYVRMAQAYIDTFPDDQFVALIDYNNREIDDTILLLENFGEKLFGVRIDTCGENVAQLKAKVEALDGSKQELSNCGVTMVAVSALHHAIVKHNKHKPKVFVSSGFNMAKTLMFSDYIPYAFDGIGTGSFIPPVPTATADIMWVDGVEECKVGREWGFEKDREFNKISTEV